MKKLITIVALALVAGVAMAREGDTNSTFAAGPAGGEVSMDKWGGIKADGAIVASGTVTSAGSALTSDLTLTDADGNAVITATGYEAYNADLVLAADQADDGADLFRIRSAASNNVLQIWNNTSTSIVASISSVGALTAGPATIAGLATVGALSTTGKVAVGSLSGGCNVVSNWPAITIIGTGDKTNVITLSSVTVGTQSVVCVSSWTTQ